MYDLKITGGTLVDGTGAEPRRADVAVKDGVIVAVGPDLAGEAAETIDATDRLVTPGFVDIHTHYDGQATWDSQLEPSASHGVTTVVTGNCGVGFAPVRPGKEEWLIQLMEGVEDIPGAASGRGHHLGLGALHRVSRRVGHPKLGDGRRHPDSPRRRPRLRDGRGRSPQRACYSGRLGGDGRACAGGDRGGGAGLLHLPNVGAPGQGRRAGAGHVRRTGGALCARPGDRRRRRRRV